MKKVTLNGKLSLKKETIAKLNDDQMNVIKGGGLPPYSNKGNCETHNSCGISAAVCSTSCF